MDKKIVTLDSIRQLTDQYRSSGKTIVFTNGCFDILHAGHVSYLARAKQWGDVLVLGLNSDASVRGIKGDRRPVIHEAQRACVAAALAVVDHVVLFDEPDPENLIHAVIPDILVKGADWPEDQIVGADFVKANGGRVERIVFEQDISTTGIIRRVGQLFYDAD